ncbi:MAG TPA: type II toxin-antitoxin system prevent-host-death family antitoxin [Solirubrobacterales bacterium]|nr:type II toxin-antitoxin system prevent-host-death family antitoxin [Solirubrobacterales bacterium]
MREIGVRELKSKLSSVLHTVEKGEQIRVTVRGRPVAEIVPTGGRAGDARLKELVASGQVTPASRARPTRRPRPMQSRRSAASIVLAERDAER